MSALPEGSKYVRSSAPTETYHDPSAVTGIVHGSIQYIESMLDLESLYLLDGVTTISLDGGDLLVVWSPA